MTDTTDDGALLDALSDYLFTGPISSLIITREKDGSVIVGYGTSDCQGPTLRAATRALIAWRKAHPYDDRTERGR